MLEYLAIQAVWPTPPVARDETTAWRPVRRPGREHETQGAIVIVTTLAVAVLFGAARLQVQGTFTLETLAERINTLVTGQEALTERAWTRSRPTRAIIRRA